MKTLLLIFIILSFSSCYEEPDGLNPFEKEFIPPSPTNLQLKQISDSEVRLSWNFIYEGEYQEEFQEVFQGFKIEKKTSNGSFIEIASVSPELTFFIDTGLSILDTCFYRIKAFTENKESDFSSEKSIQTVFSAPTNLQVIQISDSEAKLTWEDNSTFEDGFIIERRVNGDSISEIMVLPTDSTSFTDSGLSNNDYYFYRVQSFTNLNKSAFSIGQGIQTNFPAPTNLQITQLTDSEIRLTWQDNSLFEDGFIVERKEDSGNFTEIATVEKDSTNFIDLGLLITKFYTYRVTAVNLVNSSNFTQEQSIQTTFPAPTNLQILQISDSEVQLTWEDNTTFEDGFKIEKKTNNGNFIETANLPNDSTSLIDSGLSTSDIHLYRVRAFTLTNFSEFTQEQNIQTSFPAPTNLQITSISDSEVQLTWEDNFTFEDGFKIERKDNTSNFAEIAILSANSTSFNDLNLNTKQIYTYKITAFTNLNTSQMKTSKINFLFTGAFLLWTGNHSAKVNSIAFSSDGTKVVSGSDNALVKVWDSSNGSLLWTGNHSESVLSVTFSPDGTKVVSGGFANTVKVWDSSNGSLLWTGIHSGNVNSVAFSIDGTKVVSGSVDHLVKVWDSSNGSLLWTGNHSKTVFSVAFSYDGTKVVSGSADKLVKVWDSSNGSLLWTGIHSEYVMSVAFSPNGTQVLSGSHDTTVKVWDSSNGSLLWRENHATAVLSVAFSHDGAKVVSSGIDGLVKVWDSSNGSLLWTGNHSGNVRPVAFSPDDSQVISGNNVNTVKVWNSSNGSLLWTENHSAAVMSVAFSSDGTQVISGGYAKTVKVWQQEGEWLVIEN